MLGPGDPPILVPVNNIPRAVPFRRPNQFEIKITLGVTPTKPSAAPISSREKCTTQTDSARECRTNASPKTNEPKIIECLMLMRFNIQPATNEKTPDIKNVIIDALAIKDWAASAAINPLSMNSVCIGLEKTGIPLMASPLLIMRPIVATTRISQRYRPLRSIWSIRMCWRVKNVPRISNYCILWASALLNS